MKQQSGYTILEVLLAMAIFTGMLLIISIGYLNIVRLYRASAAARDVQQNARFVSEQLTREARNATHVTVNGTSICLTGAKNTIFYVDASKALHQAAWNTGMACSPAGATAPDAILTSGDAMVAKLTANDNAGLQLRFNLWLASRTNLVNQIVTRHGEPACRSGQGSEFCAVQKVSTSVVLRKGATR